MSLIPAITQDEVTVGVARSKITDLVTIDPNTKSIILVIGGDIWMGGVAVETAGTDVGLDLVLDDKVRLEIDGPGADSLYFIANGNQTMRVEQYG